MSEDGRKGTVRCVGSHPTDLADGRVIAVGERAEDVDLDNEHNQRQIADGHIVEVEAHKTKRRNRDGS